MTIGEVGIVRCLYDYGIRLGLSCVVMVMGRLGLSGVFMTIGEVRIVRCFYDYWGGWDCQVFV